MRKKEELREEIWLKRRDNYSFPESKLGFRNFAASLVLLLCFAWMFIVTYMIHIIVFLHFQLIRDNM